MMRSQFSWVSSSLRANPPIPAQLTSTPGVPSSAVTAAIAGSIEAHRLTSTRVEPGHAARRADLRRRLFPGSGVQVEDGHTRTLGAESARGRAPEPRSGTGDHRDLIVEAKHACLFPHRCPNPATRFATVAPTAARPQA